MALGVARAATSPELAYFRTPGQGSKLKAAILSPAIVYTARINQTFSTWDSLLEITYDGGVGTLADVKADMTMLIGSTAGAHDIGICRVRSIDATKVYIGETSDVRFAYNHYLTILRDWSVWAKHVRISAGVPLMDGTIAYTDQHAAPDPTPIMGGNRVLKLTGATVSTQFDWSASYVIGGLSTITGYATVAPTASASSGMTTSTPTITFNVVGWHPVYLTLTAANGKTMMAVRWVYVWNDANPPASVILNGNPRQDAETGGWRFSITLHDNVTLSDVRDHALAILFAEDQYGNTNTSIGQVAGCENVCVEGWIAGEEIHWHPEVGSVSLTAYTAQYWFGKIPAYPDGVELTSFAPTAWTQFQGLTVDKGLWHFLHWRSTATRVMDVFLTGDTKYTREVSSLAGNLWEQLREMAFLQIFARPGVNAHNQLFIQVHPQLVPLASRTWATVMTITKPDWQGEIDFNRVTVTPCAVAHLSGVAVDVDGNGVPYFSLSPGHAYPHYGDVEMLDNLLVASQADANQKAGLYRGWLNNPYPNIDIPLSANNRMIDCFPMQKYAIVIAAGDTPRGIAYSGNLIPTSVELVHDPRTGYLHTETVFEAETFEDTAIIGDPPGGSGSGSGTIPVPPGIKFPPLPDYTPVYPGDVSASEAPLVVLGLAAGRGLVRTSNFDAASVTWQLWNSGIESGDLGYIAGIKVTPNGAVYVLVLEKAFVRWVDTIYYAPAIGATFTKFAIPVAWGSKLFAMGHNPNKAEEVALIVGDNITKNFMLGSGAVQGGWTYKSAFGFGSNFMGGLTFGANKWVFDANGASETYWIRLNAEGTSVELVTANFGQGAPYGHARAGTSAKIFRSKTKVTGVGTFLYSVDNADNVVAVDIETFGGNVAVDPTGSYLMANWDSAAGNRGRSSDGAASWSGIPNLPFGGAYCFAYAGGAGLNSRWIAARGTVQYSKNFGDLWNEKTGNLLSLIPTGLSITQIVVPGF